jgi:hypothetical protein
VLVGWVVVVAGVLSSFALFVVPATGTMLAGTKGPAAPLRGLAVVLTSIRVMFGLTVRACHRITRGSATRPVASVLLYRVISF